jgi:hypothetical protein
LTAAGALTFNGAFSVPFLLEVALLLRTLAFAFVALLWTAPCHANTRYVSGDGSDDQCNSNIPCLTIAVALSVSGPGDIIVCLTPPSADPINITFSVTIDCSTARAPVHDRTITVNNASVAVSINIPVSARDPNRTVRLRGLAIDGSAYDRGIDIQAATSVSIEDCVISNVKQQGILDHRTGGQTKLFIKDTVISGNGGAGIVAASAAVGITVLDNVTSENNTYGIAAATGNNVAIRNSVFSGNSTAGIEGDAGSQITVEGSKISHNNVGVQSQSSVRISNNSIEFNNTAFNGTGATMGSNRFSGNGSMGTPRMPISGAPADVGP